MNWRHTDLRTRLRLIAAVILLIGFGMGLWLYVTAENAPIDAATDQEQHSKMYVRNLQVYGGNMAVMEDELYRWFSGLWQGTSLAYTVAGIAVLISGGFFFVASKLPSGSGS